MQTNIKALKTWTFNILEEMCFLLPTEPGNEPVDPRECITVIIMAGEHIEIYLSFDPALGREIAANSLGIPDEEISEELIFSSVKEITNIVAGNFINSTGLPPNMNLSIPKIIEEGPPDSSGTTSESYARETIYVSTYPIHLTLIETHR